MTSGPAAKSQESTPLNIVQLGSAGPTIVMLHGWGQSLQALRPLGELLSSSCKVILIDLPGFGGSPLPFAASNEGGGWTTEDYAEQVYSNLSKLGVSSCILLGHSFGGRVSVRLAAKYPRLARGMVLIGSHGLSRERPLHEQVRLRIVRAAIKVAKRIDGLFGTRLFAHYFAPRFGSRDYLAAGELRKTLVKTVNENLAVQAQSIDVPALLLWGADDSETPVDLAKNFHRLIRGSELVIFPNKGHEPFADVGSHLLASYIERFLENRGLRGS